MRSHVEYLARKGFLACSFDPPGTWDSPGGIGLYTMTNYLKAINELIAHFGGRPTVLMGHSRGGSMAMLAGTRNNRVTHIIAAMSRPDPSQISHGAEARGYEISYRDTPNGGRRKFVLPLSYFVDAQRYSMRNALSTCAKPKLFILGTEDTVVTPESVRETYQRSSPPKQLYEVESDHDYRRHPGVIKKINSAIGKFLAKY